MLVQQIIYIYIGPEYSREWLYKQNEQNDVRLNYEVFFYTDQRTLD